MTKPRTITIDGKPYSWRELVERRKAQLKEAAVPDQPLLFDDLKEDHRPPTERTASDRYRNPSLFDEPNL